MSKVAARIELTDSEKEELPRTACAHSVAHRERQRAKIILLSSEDFAILRYKGRRRIEPQFFWRFDYF
jgi:hypothetical protein